MALAFQDFQREFGRHLRDPHRAPRPAGLPARRVAAYNELLFNNICGFLDACFPVCRALLGESRWRRLNRTFYRDWPLHTPWFREIPREFVRYLADAEIATARPRWLAELAHYEWAELAVDIMDVPLPEHDPTGDLMLGRPVLNPARLDLSYAWPVHCIGTDYRPRRPQATQLVVYRDADLAVQFTEINPVTGQAYRRFAYATQEEKGKTVIEFTDGLVSAIEETEDRKGGNVKIIVPPVVFGW